MHWCACVCVRMWAVRSSVHARTNGFARVRARHRRLQACVVVRRAAVRRPGSGHIQQPRLGHIRRTHPTLRRCTQGSHATAKGQRNRTRRQRVAPNPAAHTRSQIYCVATKGAGAVRSALACLRGIVQLAKIWLHVGGTSFERLRQLTVALNFRCTIEIQSNWRAQARVRGHAGPTCVTGTGALFCFSSSTCTRGVEINSDSCATFGLAVSPWTGVHHPASTRMQNSAILSHCNRRTERNPIHFAIPGKHTRA